MEKSCKVCVTGGTGYIGSSLVKKLLDKGYTVHATLRDLKNESKVGLLKSLSHSEGELLLFEADIYNPNDFEAAIEGCEFVFHVATPLAHEAGSQYKDTTEASLGGIKSIIMSCVRVGTVKRLIYTASVVSASPLKDDESGFNDFMDETCWTPLNDSLTYLYDDDDSLKDYVYSKTLTEKHILSYGKNENGSGLEIVTLPCGLVGGDTLQSFTPVSVTVLISQVTHNENAFKNLKFLEKLLGKIPLVHVDDVCEAHIFCMENDSIISGRYLCAYSYISSKDIEDYYALHYPQFNVKQDNVDVVKKDIKWNSTKLCEKGFVYRYDTKMILDDSIKCARRVGDI